MTDKEIKESLCVYDSRNPDFLKFIYDEEDMEKYRQRKEDGKCFCDNCFTRRTKLAEEIIRLRDRPK